MVEYLEAGYSVSARRACKVMELGRSTHYYESVADPQTALRRRLRDLAPDTRSVWVPSVAYPASARGLGGEPQTGLSALRRGGLGIADEEAEATQKLSTPGGSTHPDSAQ
jgi:hypothetical protein